MILRKQREGCTDAVGYSQLPRFFVVAFFLFPFLHQQGSVCARFVFIQGGVLTTLRLDFRQQGSILTRFVFREVCVLFCFQQGSVSICPDLYTFGLDMHVNTSSSSSSSSSSPPPPLPSSSSASFSPSSSSRGYNRNG